MGNGINKVLPDLYLGNLKDARDKDLLMQHNITHILSIHDTAAPVLEDMTYLCIAAADHRKQNLIQFFKDSIIFIHNSRVKGEGCLVHCVAGVSRSVTLVVAYIMTVTGRGWVESLAAVRAARPCAGPNLGFLRQLDEFENTELKEYRTWWKNQYGMHPLHSNDEEEVEKLLMQRFKGNDLPTIITKSLVTSGT
ncbi:dual specificity protein phosphatase 22-B-like isoform X1 [Corythoichthys intestinalis]|uniref:dual specificity protein phosphatase 22-B-like isoform X1 n=1 Tax=Corythoichthys intestinalis TaxID=161448 RepID=UPI0025A5BE16|nr:dual specificity protein phosphatase 22-B-like isoform X1 [Corythoichthys intestinalis]XP_061791191.1 dual specificity protein phosphatase 22-B-like [Nerophis lumbriciformis]